jgi:hypothetical protein
MFAICKPPYLINQGTTLTQLFNMNKMQTTHLVQCMCSFIEIEIKEPYHQQSTTVKHFLSNSLRKFTLGSHYLLSFRLTYLRIHAW